MATTRRRKNIAVIDELITSPHKFQLFQTIRLLQGVTLEPSYAEFGTSPVGGKAQQASESILFSNVSSLRFSPSDVASVVKTKADYKEDSCYKWSVSTQFMSLTGSHGVLPLHFTELLQQQLREKNTALKDFFDIFNHRSISLYYRAWEKYQLPINYEKSKRKNNDSLDRFTTALASLIGLGTQKLRGELPIPLESLIGYSGFLSRSSCSANQLENLISSYFDLDVNIEQFVPQWQSVPVDVQTRMPCAEQPMGMNNILGENMLLGTSGYHIQSKFLVKISPLPYDDFMSFAPGSKKLQSLQKLIAFAAGQEFDFDLSITVNDAEIPAAALVDNAAYQPRLGWNTHLSLNSTGTDLVEVVLAKDSRSINENIPTTH
ncbi:MAG: type VI secretion system protein ImpH [Flavobacteriales bacterium]|jgi:type VI secretion system protein ImpH